MTISTPLDQQMLIMLCSEAGADDVGFVDLESDALSNQRTSVQQAMPWARSILVFVRRLNRHALRTPLRSLSSAEFIAGGHDVHEIVHRVVRDLEIRGMRAVGLSGLFPFEVAKSDGPPSVVSMKHLAEAAGLGRMGKSRMLLHPHFGADIYIGAIVLDGQVGEYDRPLADSPCLSCNLCVAACPTGAIAKDGHFDFGSCMTHNYREKVGNFVQWVHTIADSRNRHDYRRRVSDAETLSWWQSLGYEANTHCDYCVAVCPAGDEAEAFMKDRKTHFRGIVQPLRERQEAVYVVPGSDAEAHVVTAFPQKSVRRIGSGRTPSSIKGMVTMLPLLFQRGQSKGLAARYHFRFRGKEALEVTVDIRDQHIKVDRGLLGKADMTVTTTGDSWLRFLTKDCNLYWEMLRGHNLISESFTSNFWVTGVAMIRYLPRAIRTPQVDDMAFFSEAKLAEYQSRISALKPTSTHCWGTMTVDQGLHHLNLACGHAHGFYQLDNESYLTSRTLFRWILVDWFPEQPVGLRLPKGFKLARDQRFDFHEEQAKLLTIIQEAWNKRSASEWGPHCMFGKMSLREWGKLLQIHIDYHIRQFGA